MDLSTKLRRFFAQASIAVCAASPLAVPADFASASGRKIILDPGHGGQDTGASHGSTVESEIALQISKLIEAELVKAGHVVVMTRSKDEAVSLERRAALANESKGDLFVSIHLNASTDPRAEGKEFYFQNQLAVDEAALFLANRENHGLEEDRVQKAGLRAAEAARIPELKIANNAVRTDVRNILEDLDRNVRIRDSSELAKFLYREWQNSDASKLTRSSLRGIRQAPFFLVSNVAMPSVLVEVGFLTNPKESARLKKPDYQSSIAVSLATGIDRFFKRNQL